MTSLSPLHLLVKLQKLLLHCISVYCLINCV
jgi:hypothetical protein